ncbi:unnamed protein product [Sphagnum jensenii]|uniref:Glucose-6-phosphate isomerase n=1 Tax=Sphagnum jensenii TaxID=128206 RepID=A0ABP0W104_9BRYO
MQATAVVSKSALISETPAWTSLKDHLGQINKTHLEYDGVVVDFSRQRATHETLDKLLVLAKEARLKEKIEVMFNGEHINTTEDRSVLHVALRAPQHEQIYCDGKNVVPDVWGVLDKIKDFTDRL